MVLLSVLFLSVTTGQFRGWHIGQVLAFGLTAVVLAYFSLRASRPEWLAGGVLAAFITPDGRLTAIALATTWLVLAVPREYKLAWLVQLESGLLIVFLLFSSELGTRVGLNFGLVIVTICLLSCRGFIRSFRSRSQLVTAILFMLGGISLISIAGFVWSVQSASTSLRTTNVGVRTGLSAANQGELNQATESLDEARRSTATALKMLNSWFAQPARVVPVLAQHRRAVVQTVKAVDDTLGTISSEVALVDLSSLEPKRGRFDTQSIIGSQLPMEQIVASLVELQRSVEDVDSPWLVPPARRYLQELSVELDDAVRQGQQTLVALRMAPPLLGANGKRTYFVAFTTPSEIRGSLGFMGNWAEFTADHGQILMTRFGRSGELNDGGNAPRRVTAPPDWMRGWAPYGFNTGEGGTAQREV